MFVYFTCSVGICHLPLFLLYAEITGGECVVASATAGDQAGRRICGEGWGCGEVPGLRRGAGVGEKESEAQASCDAGSESSWMFV